MASENSANLENAKKRLVEMVFDHLGTPRPRNSAMAADIEGHLLPIFIEMGRLSWFLVEPHRAKLNGIYNYMAHETEANHGHVNHLMSILLEMRIFDLLDELSQSSEIRFLSGLEYDDFEHRLLRKSGMPNPERMFRSLLIEVSQDPTKIADADKVVMKAGDAFLKAHDTLLSFERIPTPSSKRRKPIPNQIVVNIEVAQESRNKRKFFSGLGSLFSGLVLLGGDAVVATSAVLAPPLALTLLGSFAGGVAAAGKGIGDIVGEGQ